MIFTEGVFKYQRIVFLNTKDIFELFKVKD